MTLALFEKSAEGPVRPFDLARGVFERRVVSRWWSQASVRQARLGRLKSLPRWSRHVLPLLAAAAVACGSEASNTVVAACVEQCDLANECEGGSYSCLDKCEAEYDTAEHLGCEAEYENLIDCLGALPNICNVSDCAAPVSSYSVCAGFFCGANPEDPLCTSA